MAAAFRPSCGLPYLTPFRGAGEPPNAAQRELWEEMVTFPFADRDDLVDAAAMTCAWLLDRREPRVW